MPIITWNNSYSVNIAEIDKQHMKLVELINVLYDAMKEGKGNEVMANILNELVKYTIYHFGFEESILAKYNYPDFNNHKKEHVELTQKVNELKSSLSKGSIVLTIQTMTFLKDWLNNHIKTVDKEYSTFLNNKGLK